MVLGLGNAEVKRVRSLRRDGAARDAEGVFLVESARMLRDALAAGVEIETVYLREGAPRPDLPEGLQVVDASPRAFDSMCDTQSGTELVAVALRPRVPDNESPHFALVLDSIADPGNVGTLIRSAEAAGVDTVWLVGPCADPWSPKVVRSSAGAIFLVPVRRVTWQEIASGARAVLGLTSSHRPDAVELADLTPGRHWSPGGPVAVVVGNEARGVSDDAPVSVWVTISHRGRVESLNAAMAGTVACMHMSRLLAPQMTRRASGDH